MTSSFQSSLATQYRLLYIKSHFSLIGNSVRAPRKRLRSRSRLRKRLRSRPRLRSVTFFLKNATNPSSFLFTSYSNATLSFFQNLYKMPSTLSELNTVEQLCTRFCSFYSHSLGHLALRNDVLCSDLQFKLLNMKLFLSIFFKFPLKKHFSSLKRKHLRAKMRDIYLKMKKSYLPFKKTSRLHAVQKKRKSMSMKKKKKKKKIVPPVKPVILNKFKHVGLLRAQYRSSLGFSNSVNSSLSKLISYYYNMKPLNSTISVAGFSCVPATKNIKISKLFKLYKQRNRDIFVPFLKRIRALNKRTHTLFLKATGSNIFSTLIRDKRVLYSRWSGMFGLKKRLKYRKHASFKIASFFHRYISVLYKGPEKQISKLNIVINGFYKLLVMCMKFFGNQIKYSCGHSMRFINYSSTRRRLRLNHRFHRNSYRKYVFAIKTFVFPFLSCFRYTPLEMSKVSSYFPEFSASEFDVINAIVNHDNNCRSAYVFNCLRTSYFTRKVSRFNKLPDAHIAARRALKEKIIHTFCTRYGLKTTESFFSAVSSLKKYKRMLFSSSKINVFDFSGAYALIYLFDLLNYNELFFKKFILRKRALSYRFCQFMRTVLRLGRKRKSEMVHVSNKDKNYVKHLKRIERLKNLNRLNRNRTLRKLRKASFLRPLRSYLSKRSIRRIKLVSRYLLARLEISTMGTSSPQFFFLRKNLLALTNGRVVKRSGKTGKPCTFSSMRRTASAIIYFALLKLYPALSKQLLRRLVLRILLRKKKTKSSCRNNLRGVSSFFLHINKYQLRSSKLNSKTKHDVMKGKDAARRKHRRPRVRSFFSRYSRKKYLLLQQLFPSHFLRLNNSISSSLLTTLFSPKKLQKVSNSPSFKSSKRDIKYKYNFVAKGKRSKAHVNKKKRYQAHVNKKMAQTHKSKTTRSRPTRGGKTKNVQRRKKVFSTQHIKRTFYLRNLLSRNYSPYRAKIVQHRGYRPSDLVGLIRTRMRTFTQLIYSVGYIKYQPSLSHGGCLSRSRYYDKRYI